MRAFFERVRAVLAKQEREQQQAQCREHWTVACTLLVPLRLGRWRTARAGAVVSLPAWQAIGLHRAGKARVHLGVMAVPDDFQGPARRAEPPRW